MNNLGLFYLKDFNMIDNIITNFHDLNTIPPFEETVNPKFMITADKMNVLQMNIGRKCNLVCKHCHLSCGPGREEAMSKDIMIAALKYAKKHNIPTIDITGGAPEMVPDFRFLVENASKTAPHVIIRSNLVILNVEGYTDLPEFYKKNAVEIVCSLPYYRANEVDKVRGEHSFSESIKALQKLNSLGYGTDKNLPLNLVYNPAGAFFPPDQTAMELEYKEKLYADFGISFNSLYTIYNNPIGRFGAFLKRSGNLERYMKKLYDAFNPIAAESLMCRFQLCVDYDGRIYDCDFNLAAGLPSLLKEKTIFEVLKKPYKKRKIRVDKHCFACTAGAGSS